MKVWAKVRAVLGGTAFILYLLFLFVVVLPIVLIIHSGIANLTIGLAWVALIVFLILWVAFLVASAPLRLVRWLVERFRKDNEETMGNGGNTVSGDREEAEIWDRTPAGQSEGADSQVVIPHGGVELEDRWKEDNSADALLARLKESLPGEVSIPRIIAVISGTAKAFLWDDRLSQEEKERHLTPYRALCLRLTGRSLEDLIGESTIERTKRPSVEDAPFP